MDIYAVIMAGGVGSRFWPRSKEKKPKQLIRIFGENTMIQDTVFRLDGIIKKENILIITNNLQKARVIEQLPQIPEENIIAEPFGKNTAACIGLSLAIIRNKSKDAVVVTLPSDHLIINVKEFQNTIKTAVEFSYSSKGLVTIGINPTHPETGYGYIQVIDGKVEDNVYKVSTFAEKPILETAKRFIDSGDFFWNSGMFIWHLDAILKEIYKYMPELYQGIEEMSKLKAVNFEKSLTNIYGKLRNISIDYGIMEKSDNVFLTKGSFDWSDVGSWEAVYQLSEKDDDRNVKVGDVYFRDTSGSYIFTPKKFTAVLGVDNLIVIDTKDALLICSREKAQDVKHVVEYLKMHKRNEHL